MKKAKLFLAMTVLSSIFFASCEKNESLSIDSIAGKYVGTLTSETGLKSSGGTFDGTADITDTGDGQIEVHCYGGDVDTTFMLDYYENGDSTMVCLNGDAFEQMYGHMMGDSTWTNNMGDSTWYDNMGGNMGGNMGDTMGGAMDWSSHMNQEHLEGDEHFGGFDMNNDSFDYTMQTGSGDIRFQGTKTDM